MSTLEISEIVAAGETAGRAVSGIAAAWVNFDGTGTVAVRDSMNVASLADNGTGDYTVNFSNSMASVGYSWSAGGSEARAYGTYVPDSYNASSKRFNVKVANTLAHSDADDANFQAFGDLA